jgi:hypothetical protein
VEGERRALPSLEPVAVERYLRAMLTSQVMLHESALTIARLSRRLLDAPGAVAGDERAALERLEASTLQTVPGITRVVEQYRQALLLVSHGIVDPSDPPATVM